VPDPHPGPGEVLISVDYIEVLFLDTQLRSGWGQDFFPMRPPWVPGTGVAGTVTAVGQAVSADRVGARVIARTGNEGAYAEQVVLAANEVFDIPDGLDAARATAALHDAVLALDRLERAGLTPGSRVLVTAAAGSLGQWFVPLAKAAGAYVVGVAGGPVKAAAVAKLGAQLAVDYRQPDWATSIGGDFDVVFDGVGGDIGRTALSLTADGGRFFGHGAASGNFAAVTSERNISVVAVDVQLTDDTWRRHTHHGLALLAGKQVQPIIGQHVPLTRAAEAHQAMADRSVIGKTLLTV
jgi:NADPH2:quinone reductase